MACLLTNPPLCCQRPWRTRDALLQQLVALHIQLCPLAAE
jgi:hypothetical protein